MRAEVPACVMKEAICFWSISNGFVQGQSISCSLLVALNFLSGHDSAGHSGMFPSSARQREETDTSLS